MLLQEIILQTRQSLQEAVTSNWQLVERHPPVEQPFQLASDVELTLVDRDLAGQVMDCCEARVFGFPKPVRQSPNCTALCGPQVNRAIFGIGNQIMTSALKCAWHSLGSFIPHHFHLNTT